METKEYTLMYELEEGHWWYRGLHDLLFSTISKLNGEGRGIKILDAGCGTGFTMAALDRYGRSFGVDISDIALGYCRKRGLSRMVKGSIEAMPFADASFDIVILTDVLYHRLVRDDLAVLGEAHRVLKSGGHVIINEPAHNYMRRNHDTFVHTRHRYEMSEMCDMLRKKGFNIIKRTYRNMLLGAVLVFFKFFVWKIKKDNSSNLKPIFPAVNGMLYAVLKAENMALNVFDMPWGLSVFCVAKKV
ncbi:MAG: class I SAM-dependent methyltransferase [Candidatus Omnitrophota bacterium]